MADTMRVWWEGPDGSVWNLIDPTSPTFAVSIEGLGEPDFAHQWSQSGARDGMRHEGTTWNMNTVTLTVQVGDSYPLPGRTKPRTGQEWRDLDRAFRKAFSAEKPGKLYVETAGRRHLEMLLDGRMIVPGAMNPAERGTAIYVIPLVAGDQPWWQGEPISERFPWANTGQNFFGGNDGSVLFYISPFMALDSSRITNSGDRPVRPTWWAKGPGQPTIGVGGQTFTFPITLAAGEEVHVDSDAETITDANGNSLWPQMGFSDPTFPPIPAEGSVDLTTGIASGALGAEIGLTIIPLYEGPW